jgi:HEPN domain-containing protein
MERVMHDKWLDVKEFWIMAFDFWGAEKALPEGRFGLVPYFLLCRSLELGFKAFLADKGKTIKQLRKKPFRHDLETLLKECESNGLATSLSDVTRIREQVKWLNQYYDDKQLEYPEISHYRLPDLKDLRESVSKLIVATESLWLKSEREAAQK